MQKNLNFAKLLELITPILAFLVLTWWTWGSWPDAFIDFGREVYNAWRISEGEVLYRDLAYFNGPLSPYFNASVFYILGANLRTLFITNLALLAFFLVLVRNMLLQITDRLTAWAGIMLTLSVFSFGQYVGVSNYNFVAPYSHEATHGLILGLTALTSLWQWQTNSQFKWFILAGISAGLTFMTKPETAFATLITSISAIACVYINSRDYANIIRKTGIFLAISLLPLLTAALLLNLAMPFAQAVANVISPWRLHFIKEIGAFTAPTLMGTDHPVQNFKTILTYASWTIILFLPALFFTILIRLQSVSSQKIVKFLKKYVAIIIGVSYLVILFLIRRKILWFDALRPLPLYTVAILIWFTIKLVRGVETQRTIRIIPFTIFALVMLAKIILNAHVYHYGFVLALPATLLLISALTSWIPLSLDNCGMNGNIIRFAGLALLAVASVVHLEITAAWMSNKRGTIVSGTNAYRTDMRGQFMAMAYNEIILNTPPDSTLAVLPEGAMLNFLTYRRNPTPYSNFMPPLIKVWGEEKILRSFQKTPPDYVALFHKDMSEIGYPFFGRDYGIKLMAWVRQEYAPLKIFGDKPLVPGSRFGVEVLKRRASVIGSSEISSYGNTP